MTKVIKIVLFLVVVAVASVAITGIIKFNMLGDDVVTEESVNNKKSEVEEYVFTTQDDELGVLSHDLNNEDSVTLNIAGELQNLTKDVSAETTKYTNEDESVVFWVEDEQANLVIEDYEVPELIDINNTDQNTRRRVEVLKSNKQGDPNVNEQDSGGDEANSENCGEGTTMEDGDCVPIISGNDLDQDCDGSDDPACEALDDDDDGDSIPIEDETSEEVNNDLDQDCDGSDDPACEALDDDDDGDSVPTEDEDRAESCDINDPDCDGFDYWQPDGAEGESSDEDN